MVATLELLKSGIFQIGRTFEDGSRIWFSATASSTELKSHGYGYGNEDCVLNLTDMRIVPLDDINAGKFEVFSNEELGNTSLLDKYLNGGIKSEYFNT